MCHRPPCIAAFPPAVAVARRGLLLASRSVSVPAGCAGPAIRSQSPEIEALAQLEADTKLVGDYTAPWGLNAQADRAGRARHRPGRHAAAIRRPGRSGRR